MKKLVILLTSFTISMGMLSLTAQARTDKNCNRYQLSPAEIAKARRSGKPMADVLRKVSKKCIKGKGKFWKRKHW